MSRQDKATTERHTKMLREMLKRPDNKVCADCKRNDPRWASWNIGVFLCIRCSGIHRSMGTHISKVKSVDLDVWTPEQMASIQKWGNRLANMYWEAHLKPGHIPADHKMDSFIRSKYESRRWAMEGPPPSDPSVLENGAASTPAEAVPPAIPAPQAQAQPTYSSPTVTQSTAASPRPGVTNRQPQPRQLLSAGIANRNNQALASPAVAPAPSQQPAPPAQQSPADDLFSLDFRAPSNSSPAPTSASPPPKKDVKQDILSLFSTYTSAPAVQPAFGGFAQTQPDPVWGGFASSTPVQPQQQPQTTSLMGNAGVGMWGASSGWNAPAAPAQPNLWANTTGAGGAPQIQQQSLFTTSDVWGSTGGAGGGPTGDLFGASAGAQKKDDAFGDIWGGFK